MPLSEEFGTIVSKAAMVGVSVLTVLAPLAAMAIAVALPRVQLKDNTFMSDTMIGERGVSRNVAVSGKRGLAYDTASMANVFSGHSQVTWGYNWGYPNQGLSLSNFEYVPMLWGDPTSDSLYQANWKANVTAAIRTGTKHLLAFNEPDVNSLTPQRAAASYKQFMQPYSSSSVKLGAPAVTNGGPPTGLTWLQEFMGNCTGCTIDFVPIHWYGAYDDISYFVQYVQNASKIAGTRPLWITEFNGQNEYWNGPGTDDQQMQFMQTILPWLDSLSYVERYAYFGVFESSSNGAYLMNNAGNGLSGSGNMYATLTKSNGTKPAALV